MRRSQQVSWAAGGDPEDQRGSVPDFRTHSAEAASRVCSESRHLLLKACEFSFVNRKLQGCSRSNAQSQGAPGDSTPALC